MVKFTLTISHTSTILISFPPLTQPLVQSRKIRTLMAALGRPLKFESPEGLEASIADYFKEITEAGEPATITGLALYLGFESRQSFYDYEEREEFSYAIKRARTRIEYEYEKKLSGNNCTGPIFALKNMGWKDK